MLIKICAAIILLIDVLFFVPLVGSLLDGKWKLAMVCAVVTLAVSLAIRRVNKQPIKSMILAILYGLLGLLLSTYAA